MGWRHMWEMLVAGRKVYGELKNLCVWNKANAGMGSFYRSKHELVFVWKSGTASHINNFELGQEPALGRSQDPWRAAQARHRGHPVQSSVHRDTNNTKSIRRLI